MVAAELAELAGLTRKEHTKLPILVNRAAGTEAAVVSLPED